MSSNANVNTLNETKRLKSISLSAMMSLQSKYRDFAYNLFKTSCFIKSDLVGNGSTLQSLSKYIYRLAIHIFLSETEKQYISFLLRFIDFQLFILENDIENKIYSSILNENENILKVRNYLFTNRELKQDILMRYGVGITTQQFLNDENEWTDKVK